MEYSLFEIAKQTETLPLSFMFCAALITWIFSAFGLLHIDLDGSLSIDSFIESPTFGDIFDFIGLGTIPLTVYLSVFGFFFGTTGLLGIYAISVILGYTGFTVFLGYLLGLTLSIFVTAGVSRILRPLFRDYGEGEAALNLVGKIGILTTGSMSPTFGEATVESIEGNSFTISVRSENPDITATRGQQIVITGYNSETNLYTAIPFEDA